MRTLCIPGLLLLLFLVSDAWAKQVDPQRAQNMARNFMSLQQNDLKSSANTDLVPVQLTMPGETRFLKQKSLKPDTCQLVYFFKKEGGGFVLVSGDDLAIPILGYSTDAPVDENNLPINFLKWIEGYKKDIALIRRQSTLKSSSATTAWEQLERGDQPVQASSAAVSPLLTTKWDQRPYYNDLCPQQYWFSNKAVTGCVATAMAQVIKYHNYPVNGTGIHSYYHSNNTVTYGTLSANYGATTYDWANMPNQLTATSTPAQVKAVATLMLHCGIGVDMNYSPASSGAQILEARTQGSSCSEYALKEFFNFDKNSVKGIARDEMTSSQWISMLKTELDNRRPVLYGGIGDGGGHAFVADGYDNNNYFHFNWGWSGNSDGYYSVDALNPVDLGTGAGNGSYNRYQQVVIGIKPPEQSGGTSTSKSEDIKLFSTVSLPEIYQLNEFQFNVKIANYSSNNFYGNFCAALFDSEGKFITFIDSLKANTTLASGFYDTYTFTNKGLSVYPGKFILGIYFRPSTGNWVAVADNESFKNFVQFDILSPFGDTNIKLYDSIRVSPNTLITGQPVKLTAVIANYSGSSYYGEFGAGLFKLNGDVVQTIEVPSAVTLPGMTYETYTFNNDNITAEPGTYYIGMVHFPNAGNDQIVIAPNGFLNPVEVNVILPPLEPDYLEDNNTVEKAAELKLEFNDNLHWYYYTDINLDNQNDEDYYKFNLPAGYDYTIWARVHDLYDNDLEDENFTCDVIFAHSDNGVWSEIFDTEMSYTYSMKNGGVIYFGVIPYYEGETGTYSIEFKIERTPGSAAEIIKRQEIINVWPNPAQEYIDISAPDNILKIELSDQSGRVVFRQESIDARQTRINLQELATGIYHIKVFQSESVSTQKLIIHE